MDGEIADTNLFSTKKEYGQLKKRFEITGKYTPIYFRSKEHEEEKGNPLELQNSKQNTIIAKKEQNTNKQKSIKVNKSKVLKRKLTEDGVTIERVLSEGEASSGFETISSIDSNLDFEDIELGSSYSEHDYNVIVKFENDLAYQNGRSKNSKPRHGNLRNYKQLKYWNARQSCDGTNQSSRENDYRTSRQRASFDREWNRCSDYNMKFRESRFNEKSKRYRRSVSNDGIDKRLKRNTIAYKSLSRDNRERRYRFSGSKSSSCKARQTESKSSKSFEKSKSLNRHLPGLRQNSYSNSVSTSVWKRLDNDGAREKLKMDFVDKSPRPSNADHPVKKERTPFLVELERKLKEAENQKKVKKAVLAEKNKNKTPANVTNATPVSQEAENPNLTEISSYTFSAPSNSETYSVRHPSIPVMSLDNLPLVPGPTGLPIHITTTGEQIPHDMDGRRIPTTPSGYYLPLDPTGRLFAHIVSPGNQAVPIHMTEDGVLRLPNSEPVPYGPSHNLPVNIDGSVIPIGPDSKPLCPCPNLPKQPPLHLLQTANSDAVDDRPSEEQKNISEKPNTYRAEDETDTEIRDPFNLQLRSMQSDFLNFIQNSCGKINKADLVINYQKRAREKKENVLKCKEIEKNLNSNPSKGGIKRSIPKKLSQKKTSKNEYFSDFDIDSCDSDTETVSKFSWETKKGGLNLTEDVAPNSEDARNVLKIANSKEKFLQSNTEDFIIVKIQKALETLSKRNFNPPAFGRFILSEVLLEVLIETSPNASPLLRNRVKLPFLTPNASNSSLKDESGAVEKSAVIFSFLSQGKLSNKGEKTEKFTKTSSRNVISPKFPAFTFDFAMQCDFTSPIIKNLSMKIAEMEMEVIRLRNINANLLDGFRNSHEANKKKSEELGKALSEIEKRNNEILSLKRLIREK